MDIRASHVFQATLNTFLGKDLKFSRENKLLIHEGSARSGKTWSILQFLVFLSIKNTGLEVVLARDTRKNAKDSIWKDFLKICSSLGVKYSINRTDLIVTINGNTYQFIGLDDPHKGHGASQDIFYVNEVMGVKEESFKQRLIRTSICTIVDYNPSEDNHYIYNYQKRERTVYYKSALFKEVQGKYTKKDYELIDYDKELDTSILLLNPFAPREQVDELYLQRPCNKHDKQGTSSHWHWQVYGLGNKSAKEGLIFNNWSVIDNYDDIYAEEVYYGLDFGFSVSKTAMVEIKRVGQSLYVRELEYRTGMYNDDIIKVIKDKIPMHARVTADSARSDIIGEIYRSGINIHGCKKKGGFKLDKIKQIQGFKIYVDDKSENFIKEINSWMWRKDRFGNQLDEPEKVNDHLMDGMIYALEPLKKEDKPFEYKVYKV